MILTKIFGIGCLLFGFFMVVHFPDADNLQTNQGMTWVGILLGILSVSFGIYLLKV